MQCTSCDPELSDLLPVTHGLPTMPTVIRHSEVALYADDAVLYCNDSNPAGLECALNADLHAIANWLNDNKLKTLMLIRPKQCLLVAIPSYAG